MPGSVDDDTPEVVGSRYELRGLIGCGGMADVHRGFDQVLHREVAVKMMHGSLTGTAERQRFAAETQLMARLNDPHLVTLLDAGVDRAGSASFPWFVMELVPGPSLSSRLAEGPLSPCEAARVGAGVARGLAHVHAAGVVHRDVKPANVLLSASGAPKLADFGIARAVGESHALTQTGYAVGTAAYLAPEQVRGEPVTGRSDVYALGLVLLEALTGRRSYSGTPAEIALARLHHGPTIPVSLGAGWTRLLAQMTACDPGDRPDAAEAAERLTALAEQSAAETSVRQRVSVLPLVDASAEVATGEHAQRRPSSRAPVLLRAAVLVVAAMLVTGALAWIIQRTHGSLPVASTAGSQVPAHVSPDRHRDGGRSRAASQSHPSSAVTAVSRRPAGRRPGSRSPARRHAPVAPAPHRHHRLPKGDRHPHHKHPHDHRGHGSGRD